MSDGTGSGSGVDVGTTSSMVSDGGIGDVVAVGDAAVIIGSGNCS